MLADKLKNIGIAISENQEPNGNNSVGLSDIDTNYELNDRYSGVGERIGETLGRTSYSLSHLDPVGNKYGKYNVHPNPINSQDELNRERARNQGLGEQLWRMGVQAVGSEIVLGTLRGFGDLVDFFINLGKEKGEDDYTNAFTTQMEEWQNEIRNMAEIYQEDPNKAWAIGDSGWWTNNLVSAASTASLLLPSSGVAKGLSYLGKLSKASKLTRGLTKGLYKANMISKPATAARKINNTLEIAVGAAASRTMENYIESREVFKDSEKAVLDQLSEMTDEERQRFNELNPELVGKSDADIARYIASVSADKTFQNDYAMLLFDFMQLKALGKLYKGVKTTPSTAATRIANKNAINALSESTSKNIIEDTFWNRRKEFFKHALKNPKDGITMLGLDEGLEEMYQGIQTEKGKELAQMMLDPTISPRALKSYLTDEGTWEQAFWGVMGGLAFKGAASGLASSRNFIKNQKLKYKNKQGKISDEDLTKMLMTQEKQRLGEINDRQAKLKALTDKIGLIEQDLNPLKPNEEVESKYDGFVDASEKESVLEEVISDFITDVVLAANKNGNYELLKEYLQDPNFNKYFKEHNISDITSQQITDQILKKADKVFEYYTDAYENVIGLVDDDNTYIADIVASTIARDKLITDEYKFDMDHYFKEAYKLDPDGDIITEDYKDRYRYQRAKDILKDIEKARAKKEELRAKGEISKQALDKYNEDYDEEIVKTYEWLYNKVNKDINNSDNTAKVNAKELIKRYRDSNRNLSFTDLTKLLNKDIEDSISNYGDDTEGTDRIKMLVKTAIQRESAYDRRKREQPKTATEYEKLFDEMNVGVAYLAETKYKKALEKVKDYLRNADDLEQAERDLSNGEIDELAKELELLKIGHENKEPLTMHIADMINKEKDRRKALNDVTNDGVKGDNNDQEIINEQADEQPDDDSSTGEQTENKSNNSNQSEQSNSAESQQEILSEQERIAEEQEKGRKPNKYEVVDGTVDNTFNDISTPTMLYIHKLSKDSIDILKNVINKGINSEEYKNFREDCIQHLIDEKGLNRKYIEDNIDKSIKMGMMLVQGRLAKNPKANKDLLDNIDDLISNLSKYADSNQIPVEERDAIIEEFITDYLLSNDIEFMPKKGNKYVIRLEDLYEHLITEYQHRLRDEDKKTCENLAKHIFYNLYSFIQNNNEISADKLDKNVSVVYGETKSFIFVGKNFLKNTYKNPTIFFAKLQEELIKRNNEKEKIINRKDTYHIFPRSGGIQQDVLEKAKKGAKIKLVVNNSDSISVRVVTYRNDEEGEIKGYYSPEKTPKGYDYDSYELGYITKVKQENDGIYKKTVNNVKGFDYHVGYKDGKLWSNFDLIYDKLFKSLERKGLNPNLDKFIELCLESWTNAHIYGDHSLTKLTDTDKKLIRSVTDEIKDYFGEEVSEFDIIKQFGDVLFYDGFGPKITMDVRRKSYEMWKQNVYENYVWTHSLTQNVTVNRGYIVLPQPYFLEQERERPPLITEESKNISDSSLEFDSNEHPIVMLDQNGNFIKDDGKVVNVKDPMITTTYGMGVIVKDDKGRNFIVPITEQEKVSENKIIHEALKKEINDLLYGFQTGKHEEKKSFEELAESFSQLFSNKGKGMAKSNPFYGLGVAYNGKMISIYMNGDVKQPLLRIYKFKKGTNEEGTHILFTPNGVEDGTHQQSYVYKPSINHKIAETIANMVRFNTSKYAFELAKQKTDTQQSNKYFFKENGKLIFRIGAYREEFNNFTDYAIRVGAFRLNIDKKNGSYFAQSNDDILNIVEIKNETAYDKTDVTNPNNIKVKETKPITSIFDGDKRKTNGVTSRQFLTESKLDKTQIDALVDGEVPIIPSRIYKGDSRGKAKAYYKDGKVYVTKSGLNAIKDKPSEAVRLLIHEQIHARIEQSSILKRQNFINDVIDIIEYTIETLNEKLNNPDISEAERTQLNKILDFITNDKQFGKYYNAYKNNPTEAAKQLLVEEWLAETYSQPALIKYLNNTNYKDEQIDINGVKSNKSIWQKIIDKILQIFGINIADVKNNTIFAKQYMLFKDTIVEQSELNFTEENTKKDDDSLGNYTAEPSPDDWQQQKNEWDDLFNINDAITDVIETNEDILLNEVDKHNDFNVNGVNTYTNMNDFISQFDIKLQPKIAKMIENGTIKFVCR